MKNKGPKMYRQIAKTREKAVYAIPLIHLLINAKSWGHDINIEDYKSIIRKNDRQYGVIRWLIEGAGEAKCKSLYPYPASFFGGPYRSKFPVYTKDNVHELPF